MLRRGGKFLTGGLSPSTIVWQTKQRGAFGVTNCARWQPVQDLWPGRRGCAELSAARAWQEAHASEACRALAPAFRVGFSHAAHGARQRLSCADCHRARAGLPQSRQVSSPLAAEHFQSARAQSCMTCHDDRRAFGDANFRDCRRCHRGQTFRGGG